MSIGNRILFGIYSTAGGDDGSGRYAFSDRCCSDMVGPGVDSVWVRLGDHSDPDHRAVVMTNIGIERDLIELGDHSVVAKTTVMWAQPPRLGQNTDVNNAKHKMRMCGTCSVLIRKINKLYNCILYFVSESLIYIIIIYLIIIDRMYHKNMTYIIIWLCDIVTN